MGFGILFIGYILSFVMNIISYGYYFELIGLLLVLYASIKLMEYDKKFVYLLFSAIFLVLISVYSVITNTASNIGLGWDIPKALGTVAEYLKIFGDAVLHAALCVSVANISHDTGCKKIQIAAYRNTLFYALYFVCRLVIRIPKIAANETVAPIIGFAGNCLWLVWVAFNAIMLFSCYMNICDESDTEMTAKPSRFEFINKMRSDFDEKEARARRADAEYLREKAEKRRNKKKKGKK